MGFLSYIIPKFNDLLQPLTYKIASILATGMGLPGNDIFSDGEYHTGSWWAVHFYGEGTIVRLDFASGASTGSLNGTAVCCGDREYGPIVGIQFTGTVIAYRAASCSCAPYA